MAFDGLIHLAARGLARQIERGSRVGAFVGALVGGGAAVAITLAMMQRGDLGADRYAMFLVLGIPAVIGGAVTGAALWTRENVAVGTSIVRLTNYGGIAKPFTFALILAGIIVVLAMATPQAATHGYIGEVIIALILIVIFGIAMIVASRDVLYIEVGQQITIRRLLGRFSYDVNQLRTWGFEVARGRLEQVQFAGMTNLSLRFDDGNTFVIVTPGEYSAAVIAILQNREPQMR